ncbi:unnamed protein product [Haemonchus placei]|uniref:Transposase n=1 Tax=Haemonchus placei TaxID=6290 RepID=A0A0N4WJC9_HAEPC|nr:unnamed protein product [Haemonchus placei]
MKSSPASLLNTPRLSYRKKARFRRLLHAEIVTMIKTSFHPYQYRNTNLYSGKSLD